MLSERRQHQRYSLLIAAQKIDESGFASALQIMELSIGGAFLQWLSNVQIGDVLRIRIPLTRQNYLPLSCKIIYRFPEKGMGVKFLDLTKFEEDLIADLISSRLYQEKTASAKSSFEATPKI